MLKVMSLNGNRQGNGSGNGSPLTKSVKRSPTPAKALTDEAAEKHVTFRASSGLTAPGVLLRLSRYAASFELHNPSYSPRLSEALEDFKIVLLGKIAYAGKAIVTNLLDAGTRLVCEVALDDEAGMGAVMLPEGEELIQQFNGFVATWQKFYRVKDEYKLVIADLHTFLTDLRLWLDHVETGIRAAPAESQAKLEAEIMDKLRDPIVLRLNNMFERFETIAYTIDLEEQPAHRAFGQRYLHSLLLCAPFIYRTYAKPLGYAGDYEMMNMIVRNKVEGDSLYAKMANAYLLHQVGPMAVRGRVGFLQSKISNETGRMVQQGKKTKIFCVACGPAWEAVNFIAEHPLADHACFEFLDFNEETLRYTEGKVGDTKRKYHRKTETKFIRNSVQNLMRGKTARERVAEGNGFDLIYCSGLYDYLSDAVCKSLNGYLYDMLNPGGLMVIGNFASTPVRNFIEHFLEWFLIYRDNNELLATAPAQALRENCIVRAEPTGTNFFLEVRKPE